jgi:hypothetical protein
MKKGNPGAMASVVICFGEVNSSSELPTPNIRHSPIGGE